MASIAQITLKEIHEYIFNNNTTQCVNEKKKSFKYFKN